MLKVVDRLLIFMLLMHISISTNGQIPRFDHYTDLNGLPHRSVRAVVQDEKGFLWIGTFGGLCRFDGNEFKIYSTTAKSNFVLPDDDITEVIYDARNQCIWVGCNEGVICVDLLKDNINNIFPEDDSKQFDKQIRSLFLDNSNNLWIGSKSGGLYVYTNNKELRKIVLPNVSYVKSIFQDNKNRLWVGTLTEGITSFELDWDKNVINIFTFSKITEVSSKNPRVYNFFQENNGELYVGTEEGLLKFDTDKNAFQEVKWNAAEGFEPFNTGIICFERDSKNNLWLGTRSGIIRCKHISDLIKGDFDHYTNLETEPHSLIDNQILDVFEDKYGMIWIATENGLDKYDPYRNRFLKLKTNLSSQYSLEQVTCFQRGSNNELLIGTLKDGLFSYKDSKTQKISDKISNICSLSSFDNHFLWIGTWNGELIQYNKNKCNIESFQVSNKENPIFSIERLNQYDFLLATYVDGLIVYSISQKKEITPDYVKTAKTSEVNKIQKDEDGNFWVGTDYGAYYLDSKNQKLTIFTPENTNGGLPDIRIKDFAIDKHNQIWIATPKGLSNVIRNKDGTLSIKYCSDLPDLWITDVICDKENNLWLNINYNYIGCFNPDTKKLRLYPVDNSIRSNKYSKRGFYLHSNGLIYYGGSHDVYYFNPNELEQNITIPKPVLSDLKIHNNSISAGESVNGDIILNQNISFAEKLNLSYQNRNFGLSIFSPAYFYNTVNEFRYQLEPFENEWVIVNNSWAQNIQYTNLKQGTYTFKCQYRNNLGSWGEPLKLQIKVKPPLWASWWAIVFYSIMATSIFIVSRRVVLNRLNLKTELLMEKIQHEKDENLMKERTRFFTNISHEFRTPLTLILGPIKKLSKEIQHRESLKYINLIENNAQRMLTLVNQLLDFRKIEGEVLALKTSLTNISSLTTHIFHLFDPIADEKKIGYHLRIPNEEVEGFIDSDKYNKILTNLLSNAFKFTNEGGNIEVTLFINNMLLTIEVKDSGIGLNEEQQRKIFEPFYQVTNSEVRNQGSGIGLSLVNYLVRIHRGKIKVHSMPGKGTVFTFSISISEDSYNSNEIEISEDSLFSDEEIPDITGEINNNSDQEMLITKQDKAKIVVVDDNPDIRKFIVSILESKYTVIEAFDGKMGLELIKKHQPFMVLADVMMEPINGFEMCKQLKLDEAISHTPVILITALNQQESQVTGYKIGAEGYLTKPFTEELLLSVMQSIITNRKILKQRFATDVNLNLSSFSHSFTDENILGQIQEMIEKNIDNPDLNLNFLCENLGMSASKLYRKLKELTDLSPNDLIRTIRLKKASQLLKNSSLKINEVAYAVGFNDPLYFSKCFKKQFSYSPSEMR